MARILSVNVGLPRPVHAGKGTVSTAIWKSPVAGRVGVRGVNLDGDEQADRTVHGGPDKAVYAYAVGETRGWEARAPPRARSWRLRREPDHRRARRLGRARRRALAHRHALLEITQPRLPCFKLGLRLGDASFIRRFAQASRPGAYLRIVEEGDLGAGDAVEVDAATCPTTASPYASISDAILEDHRLIPQVLEAPQIPAELRDWMTKVIA